MPFQAQQPLPSSGEHRSRAGTYFGAPGFLVSNPSNNRAPMDGFQQQQQLQFLLGASVSDTNMHRVIPQGASPMLQVQEMALPNLIRTYRPAPAMAAGALECVDNIPTVDNSIGGARKRRKQMMTSHAQPEQVHLQQLGVDLNQTLATSFPPTLVSTGLRLAFDDERSTVTSSRPSTTSVCHPSFSFRDELSARFSSHQEDLNQFLKAQAEQLRQALKERIQAQAKSLMASVESEVARKVREKEAEMESVTQRNSELEGRVRQLSMEREMWQSKARSNEATAAILRSNLQQAMAQAQQHQSRREASRIEGCGESEADDADAASVYIDDNLTAKQWRAMAMRTRPHMGELAVRRACRQCGGCEASVLLLPCLHLCLCLHCSSSQSKAVEKCPVCSTAVSNMAEVFLS